MKERAPATKRCAFDAASDEDCGVPGVDLIERDLTSAVIAASFVAYDRLGLGFLEEVCTKR